MDLIDRQMVIDTEGLDEQIRCEMCRNPMHTDRGCDGNCKYDEKLYERIMQILSERIKPLSYVQPEITNEEIRFALKQLGAYFSIKIRDKKEGDVPVELLQRIEEIQEYVGNLPSAQFKRINKGTHKITESDKTSYAVICDKFPSPHVYFNTYDEAEHWARFNQPNYRPFYIIKRSEHFEIEGEIR